MPILTAPERKNYGKKNVDETIKKDLFNQSLQTNLCRVRPVPHLVIQQRKGNTGQKVWFLILLIHTITDACDPGVR